MCVCCFVVKEQSIFLVLGLGFWSGLRNSGTLFAKRLTKTLSVKSFLPPNNEVKHFFLKVLLGLEPCFSRAQEGGGRREEGAGRREEGATGCWGLLLQLIENY